MKIFDELIEKAEALLPREQRPITAIPDPAKFAGRRGELILGRETAFELGGGDCPSACLTLFTRREDLVPRDEILVCGPDLPDLKADSPFGRIAILRTDDVEEQGEQGAYAILESIGLKKYDVFPRGYMVRTSALSNREQVRVSKKALKAGLTFADVGSQYLAQFHTSRHVQAVRLIFVTLPDLDYRALDHLGDLSNQVLRALNHALADLKMDCYHCQWKPVCDEVDGIKALHQAQLKQANS